MAEARHGIRLTAPLEHWVRKSFDSGVGLEAAELELLADCMNAMQSVASHLDESTGFFQSHSALLARIDQATEKLEQRIIAAARAAESHCRTAPGSSTPGFRRAGGRGSPRFLSAGSRQSRSQLQRSTSPKTCSTDFDQDIASIFTDEAVELIDQAQSALAQWNENRSSVDGLDALKRPLHTLKGGARMAGLVPMGDLSHELETLFMQIDSGVVAPDDRAFSLAQTALDELARMRESVSSGKGVPTAHGLIARIHALGTPRRGCARGASARSRRRCARCRRRSRRMPAPSARAHGCAARADAPRPRRRRSPPRHRRRRSQRRPTISRRAARRNPPTCRRRRASNPLPDPPVLAAVWAPSSEPPSIVTRAAAKEPVSAGFIQGRIQRR